MVEGAALEMLCTEMYLGFESLTLRQMRNGSRKGIRFHLAEILFKDSNRAGMKTAQWAVEPRTARTAVRRMP